MITRAELHKNFSFTSATILAIRALQDRITAEDGEAPEAVAIKWARIILKDGRTSPYNVAIGFYDKKTFSELSFGDWTIINGIKLVFFVREQDFSEFYSKSLDVDADGNFFLRPHMHQPRD